MTRRKKSTDWEGLLKQIATEGFPGMAAVATRLLNLAMELERQLFLGAGPYERTETRRGYANGYKPKRVKSRLGLLELLVPQVRAVLDGARFYPQALTRGERSERAFRLALAEMYVKGVSTRKVKQITEQLCGVDVSASQVSRAAAELDAELEQWRRRSLGLYEYLVLDERYEKVRHGGQIIDEAVLTAIGIDPQGRRSVVGVSVSLSEAEEHWRCFLDSLRERGLRGLKLVISDDHAGLRAARQRVFPGVLWQRCQVHLQRNAGHYAPRRDQRPAIHRDLRAVFSAPDRDEAERQLRAMIERWAPKAPRLARWLEENVPEGFAVYATPPSQRYRLKSTNLVEWINRELLRRTRVVTIFPNEDSLLRLVSAVLIEMSESWQGQKNRYLPKEDNRYRPR